MVGKPLSRRGFMRGAVLLGVGVTAGGIDFSLDLLSGSAAAAAVASPTIASCATWGARSPSEAVTLLTNNPNKILVHHTATANVTDYSQSEAYALARSIQNDHMDVNGWIDTGQHFTISRGGYVMEGRHSSLSTLRAGSGMVMGAHCPGQNDQAIGIEDEGLYDTATPPTALFNQLSNMCAYICSQYGIAATQIFGHRDYYATDCPGDVLYGMLPQLRTNVAALLNPAWTTIIDNTSAGFAASASWSTATSNTQRYGTNYRTAPPILSSDPATYTATIPAAGNYKIDAWWPAASSYNTATPYVVYTSSGTHNVVINQTAGGGVWHNLGTFNLTAGSHEIVAVSRWTSTTGTVVADAIRITQV